MPAYHVSVNFGIRGPYFVTYPGPAQLYMALEEARAAIDAGEVDVALVMAVAHQRNFLVEHHVSRIDPPIKKEALRDVAACLVVESTAHGEARGAHAIGTLESLRIEYAPFDPLSPAVEEVDVFDSPSVQLMEDDASLKAHLGPASLICRLARAWATASAHAANTTGGSAKLRVTHRIRTRDGARAESVWLSDPSRLALSVDESQGLTR
jgi:hypothetical protein